MRKLMCGLLGPALVAWAASLPANRALGQEPEPRRHGLPLMPWSHPTTNAGPTVTDIGKAVDHVGESLRNDGIVVIKQPDVYSQARLTKYRQDFETQMFSEIGTFRMILSARIGRLDSATTTSTTSLGAALGPAGSTHVTVPTPTPVPSFGPADQIDFSKTPFGSLTVGQTNNGNLGVEPTVYLEEKKRFLEHLNEIRRISLGPDQNDSSGYGLYLVRMPVSITPGECTYEGHGADVTVAVEHEFRPDFLPATFRNLVVNDVVDQLGPVVFEVIRAQSALVATYPKLVSDRARIEKARDRALNELVPRLVAGFDAQLLAIQQAPGFAALGPRVQSTRISAITPPKAIALDRFIRRAPADKDKAAALKAALKDKARGPLVVAALAGRLDAVVAALNDLDAIDPANAHLRTGSVTAIAGLAAKLRAGSVESADDPDGLVEAAVDLVLFEVLFVPGTPQEAPRRVIDPVRVDVLSKFLRALYDSALTDDVDLLDAAVDAANAQRALVTAPLAASGEQLFAIRSQLKTLSSRSLPSTRTPKQSYPIAPREVSRFFLAEEVLQLAGDAALASQTKTPRATDVRSYLRQALYVAYDAMSRPPEPLPAAPGAVVAAEQAPLEEIDFLDRLRRAIERRRFAETADENDLDGKSELRLLRDELVHKLAEGRSNVVRQPFESLCWAIAIDATLLDAAFRDDAARTFAAKGFARPDLDAVRFYDPDDDAARGIFHEYVRQRWPIVTFALDPVTDQQNIADSFNLKRDLQLALSFAFATGQINFNQMNTFRRQIEQSSDTIALNRTVTGFAHGTDVFGFRFTPRFQNPPNQRTNLGVITSQLIAGGPGPDYGTKHSKLEPGIRELTAVVLVPGFLPTVRMQVSSNWFKLTDPEHPVIPTRRMLEQGRRVQDLRGEFASVTNAQCYRPEDLRVLGAKIHEVEETLHQQSKVVGLPFANTASGFDLFVEGATAMAPELVGFEGLDLYKPGTQSDIFVFGKYFSIHESHVIVGGVPLAPDAFTIVSREVLQVRLPDKALATVAIDGQKYIEVHVATPNGISNRLLVPVAADPPPASPPKLDPKTAKFTLSYQWLGGRLVASVDPDPKGDGIVVNWAEGPGPIPAALQVKLSVPVDARHTVDLVVPALRGDAGVYKIDRRLFVAELLWRAQVGGAIIPGGSFDPVAKATLSARPAFQDISADFVKIDDPLEIDFDNRITDVDVLRGLWQPIVVPIAEPVPVAVPAPPTPAPAGNAPPGLIPPAGVPAPAPAGVPPADRPVPGPMSRRPSPSADPAVRTTQFQIPASAPAAARALLPADAGLPPLPVSPSAATSAVAAMLLGQNPAGLTPEALQARLLAASAAARQPISVNPTTVVVVPPAVDPKAKKDHHLRLFGRGKTSPPGR